MAPHCLVGANGDDRDLGRHDNLGKRHNVMKGVLPGLGDFGNFRARRVALLVFGAQEPPGRLAAGGGSDRAGPGLNGG